MSPDQTVSVAPPAADEAERLATLASYQIMDTPPERSFNCLVELASEHFGVPISVVSLIGADRQWFKASIGLDATETSRTQAFCAHTILDSSRVLVVEDATKDPRFADNPLVVGEPSIRFYAGAPILAENGQPLGTLCVIDSQQRCLDEAGRGFLSRLAASAGSLLELHRKNLLLSTMSGSDPLTGLANRRIFDTALATACADAIEGVPFGLLALDLDHFKRVNDEFGHAIGDSLLWEVAQRLNAVVRAKDLVARLGGDEFAIIAPGPVDLAGLQGLASRIMHVMATDMTEDGHTIPIRLSIGVALAPLHGTEPRVLLRAADVALFRSKQDGRQAVTVAATDDDPQPSVVSELESELRQAINEQTILLFWQPYFAAMSGQVAGYETLIRWHRPGKAPVSPSETIALAERCGLIVDLDQQVLRRACTEAASWPQPVHVSVNMTAWWFNSGDLVALVSNVLAETGLPPSRLTIELTEGTLVQHTQKARERIAGLHAIGVRVALDDFGTGYASLGYLCSFDFDKLKLDRSFVQALGTNPRAEAVAQAVLALAKALDMVVCAEGIETPEQLRFLQNAGCDLIQGFLLGRPMPRIDWPRIAASPSEPAAAGGDQKAA